MPNLAHALRYASKGKPVFPCHIKKTPLTENGFKDATTETNQIKNWWLEHPEASIGMPTGKKSGVWVLDVDLPDGVSSLAQLEQDNEKLPETLAQKTGSGGFQYFFSYPGTKIKNSAGKIGKDIDVRGDGGYVILPPSHHPSGNDYEWLSSLQPVSAPQWLLSMVSGPLKKQKGRIYDTENTPYGQRALADELAAVSMSCEGSRNDQLNRSAFNLGQLVAGGELNLGTVRAALQSAAIGVGLKEIESEKTISSGLDAGMQEPRYPTDNNGHNGHNLS